jgi:hypothetical protein
MDAIVDHQDMNKTESLTIRRATAEDAVALHRLAALDSALPLTGDVLLAEVDGEPWAAIEIDGRRVIADPFRPSGDLVTLLHFRSERGVSALAPRRPRFLPLPRTA